MPEKFRFVVRPSFGLFAESRAPVLQNLDNRSLEIETLSKELRLMKALLLVVSVVVISSGFASAEESLERPAPSSRSSVYRCFQLGRLANKRADSNPEALEAYKRAYEARNCEEVTGSSFAQVQDFASKVGDIFSQNYKSKLVEESIRMMERPNLFGCQNYKIPKPCKPQQSDEYYGF